MVNKDRLSWFNCLRILNIIFMMLCCFVYISYAYAQDVSIVSSTSDSSPDKSTDSTPDGGATACSDQTSCLNSIVQNTYQALVRINNVPEQLKSIATTAISWVAKDDSDMTKASQKNFAILGGALNANRNAQMGIGMQIITDLLTVPTPQGMRRPDMQHPPLSPAALNEASYWSIIGNPPFPATDQQKIEAAYRYMSDAAGTNITHPIPGPAMRGNYVDVYKYINYFKTTMAIQTFNGYVLSNLFAENTAGNKISQAQTALIKQASSSDWIAQIASQDLGKVLRQLLMFQAQSYVLLTDLVQTQKQLLTAQIMTNTLLILNNQNTEQILWPRALGTMPH